MLEEDIKFLIELGFCDSIVFFGDFIDFDFGCDFDCEEGEEEDIFFLVDSGFILVFFV